MHFSSDTVESKDVVAKTHFCERLQTKELYNTKQLRYIMTQYLTGLESGLKSLSISSFFGTYGCFYAFICIVAAELL